MIDNKIKYATAIFLFAAVAFFASTLTLVPGAYELDDDSVVVRDNYYTANMIHRELFKPDLSLYGGGSKFEQAEKALLYKWLDAKYEITKGTSCGYSERTYRIQVCPKNQDARQQLSTLGFRADGQTMMYLDLSKRENILKQAIEYCQINIAVKDLKSNRIEGSYDISKKGSIGFYNGAMYCKVQVTSEDPLPEYGLSTRFIGTPFVYPNTGVKYVFDLTKVEKPPATQPGTKTQDMGFVESVLIWIKTLLAGIRNVFAQ